MVTQQEQQQVKRFRESMQISLIEAAQLQALQQQIVAQQKLQEVFFFLFLEWQKQIWRILDLKFSH